MSAGAPAGASWHEWVGRQVTVDDEVSASALRRFAALLDAPADAPTPEIVPPLGHWLLFLPEDPQSVLGVDGHPRRGGFLPPIDLPNRLWAGSAITFHQPIAAGARVRRRSTITSVESKTGRSGPLAFVSLHHEIRAGEVLAIEERQDVAYRTTLAAGPSPGETVAPDPRSPERTRTVTPDATQLFRYSALTFNAHRIHYDAPYTREVEGHPGLVVQGPYICTLLLDHLLRCEPGLSITAFRCRARRPAYAGAPLALNLRRVAPARWALWATDAQGRLHMDAEAQATP
jgi:3-methylfumaryl-CoA hydratase